MANISLAMTEKSLNLIFSRAEEPRDLQPSSPGPLWYLTPCFPPPTQVFLSLPLSFYYSCCVDQSVSMVPCDQRQGGCWDGCRCRGSRRIEHTQCPPGWGSIESKRPLCPSLALCLWQPAGLHNLTSNRLMTFL